MAKALTPVRVARVSRESFQNTAEEAEVDFQLAHRQGVLIHAAEFAIGDVRFVPGSDPDEEDAFLSLHAETGELERTFDAFTDALVLNSEIIAETALHVSGHSAAGGVINYTWLGQRSWNYNQLLGSPLLLATNVTFRGVTTGSALTVNSASVRIMYQYVELTDQELANQFILRR